MFRDLYDWAGMERDVGIVKAHSRFASPLFIRAQACHLLDELRDALSAEKHSGAIHAILAHFVSEMNVVHAFREGSGRHLREFVRQVIEELGCLYDSGALRRELWIPAVIAGFGGDEGPMKDLLETVIVNPVTKRKKLFAPFAPEDRRRFCAALKRSGCPRSIVEDYRKSLRC
jgi:cell filamentation protein